MTLRFGFYRQSANFISDSFANTAKINIDHQKAA